ncbi:hypothetical protein Salat_1200600 [Sesamum alatum]|uniref:EF-hand domain-containing protein n=1 Tax=Sesamum alatum TaxID=300844 RepID=A0AAE2CNT5_9LAMI|nr:hypothetical protein Salat_1200600 [Sesamum alatum]
MTIEIIPRNASSDGKVELSMEEFKKWLMKFDRDRDGRINVEELRQAIYDTGGRFCMWKARRAVKKADTNSNGVIDDNEICKLVPLAEKAIRVEDHRLLILEWWYGVVPRAKQLVILICRS